MVRLMELARSCYVVRLMEGEWLCYGNGQFNGGRMVMLQRWSQMEGEWPCYRGFH